MAQTALPAGFRITDSNDNPFSGARLFFYDAGTLDHRTVYQDAALTVAHPQPVICDAGGLVPTIYVPTGLYRVIITNSDQSVTVDDQDDIDGPIDTASLTTTEAKPLTTVSFITTTTQLTASDAGTVVNANPGAGSFTATLPAASIGNGKRITVRNTGATGAVTVDGGASTINSDNQRILVNRWMSETYVSDGADWHVDTTPPEVPQPQGRLTLVSETPVMSTEQLAKTTVYWAFYEGNICPVKFGSIMVPVEVADEPAVTLTAGIASASTIYDVFGGLFAGGFVTGIAAWSSSGAGSGSRGTGGGTPELERFQGLLVNKNSMTLRNGADTYSIAAQEATYLGSIRVDPTAGQVTAHFDYGQDRRWGVWNAYHRAPVRLRVGDSTASWAYGVNAFRASNNDPANSATVFTGLAEEFFDIQFQQTFQSGSASPSGNTLGIGIDSTTVPSGFTGVSAIGNSIATRGTTLARYPAPPILGASVVTSLEDGGGVATNFIGTETDMLMEVSYLA